MKELTPKSVMSRIRRNKDKVIYLCTSTSRMLNSSMECDDLKRYHFLVAFTDVEIGGEIHSLERIEQILEFDEDYEEGVECWYEPPKKPNGMLVL